MTTNFDALREFIRLTPCIMEQDRKTIQFLIADAESSHDAAIQATQVEMRERIAGRAETATVHEHPMFDGLEFTDSVIRLNAAKTALSKFAAIVRALPLATSALELDRLRQRREEAEKMRRLWKQKFEDYEDTEAVFENELAELDRQTAKLKSKGGDA